MEEALKGNASTLKERTIGIEVFHRKNLYSTSTDPVVRITASETRKKLAQYYCEAEHAAELRIMLPIGSYVPVFQLHEATVAAAEDGSTLLASSEQLAESAVAQSSEQHLGKGESAPATRWQRALILVAAAVLLVNLLGGAWWLWQAEFEQSAVRTFWHPFLRQKTPVLLSLGMVQTPQLPEPSGITGTKDKPLSPYIYMGGMQVLTLEDANAITQLVSLLQGHHQNVQIRPSTDTHFSDMQKAPTVLFGGFVNTWTLQFTRNLQYSMAHDNVRQESWIFDKKMPEKKLGDIVLGHDSVRDLNADCAIIVRLMNSETGQPILILGGVTAGATRAAVEFVSNEEYLKQFTSTAPRGWQDKNVELVILSRVIVGESGPPQLVASSIW